MGVAPQYPEMAAQWANTITDESQRYTSIETVARSWLRRDATAAEAWLAGTTLPDDRKEKALKAPRPPAAGSAIRGGVPGMLIDDALRFRYSVDMAPTIIQGPTGPIFIGP